MNSQGQLAAPSDFPALEANSSAKLLQQDCAGYFHHGITDTRSGIYDEKTVGADMGALPAHQKQLYEVVYRLGRYSEQSVPANKRDAFAGEVGRAVAYGFDDSLAGRPRDSVYIPGEGTSWSDTDAMVLDNAYFAAYKEGLDLTERKSNVGFVLTIAGAVLAGLGGVYLWQKHLEKKQFGQEVAQLATVNPTPGMTVQSLIFSRDQWDEKSAKGWAKDHGYRYGKVDVKPNTIRMRQRPPSEFRKNTMRTIQFGDGYGIQAVVAKPNR